MCKLRDINEFERNTYENQTITNQFSISILAEYFERMIFNRKKLEIYLLSKIADWRANMSQLFDVFSQVWVYLR